MRRLLGLSLWLILWSASLSAQSTAPPLPFSFYIHDSTGVSADTPLPSIYQFPATSLGSNSNVVIKITNTSTAPAFLAYVAVTVASGSLAQSTNFTVTGLAADTSVAVGDSFFFTVNFSPTTTGPITAYLEITYQVQQNGCDFTSNTPATQCQGGLNTFATVTGMATEPQLVLTYENAGSNTLLQPSATAPLFFGNISTSATSAITFTLANQSTVDLNVPSITLPPPTVYSDSAFLLDTSQVPATLGAGESATFTVTFEPGQVGFRQQTLIVGSNTYLVSGAGIIVADIDALQISYVDSTGVRSLPEAATPISFGQVIAGTSGSSTLTFTVTNPTTSYNSVSLANIAVTGSSFSLGTVSGASSFPTSLAPGTSLSFPVTFVGGAGGNATGTLMIGSRAFALGGFSTASSLPAFTLAVNPSPLASQEQATVAVQFATAPMVNLVGTLTMTFTPSVVNVKDDPAILFIATSGRTLNLSVTAGSTNATYNGQSALTFQTGTTAGTIQFTMAFPNAAAYSQSFTVTPSTPQITSASAVRSDPNLVVTLAGYDNTYSAGMLTFTFYDINGNKIAPVSFDATSDFQQLFFNNNTGGGTFSVQAKFPVTGNVMEVGSVSVSAANSAGQANSTQAFH